MALTTAEEALVRLLLAQQAEILSLAGNEPTIISKLGATKITLSDMIPASSMDDADLMLIRQGTTDKSIARSTFAQNLMSQPAGSNYVGFLQSGTDAIARTAQSKMRDSISVFDFMTATEIADVQARTLLIDVTAAVQAAINAAILDRKNLLLNSGKYKTTSTLVISDTSIMIYGEGRYETVIDSYVVGSAIRCETWGGVLDGFSVLVQDAAGKGIEAGLNSRNCAISNVYLQLINAATATGAGILLKGNGGWSGGLEIRTVYALGFKYGCLMQGTNLATDTWTTVSFYNFWAGGYSVAPIVGSAGIYMDANTNGIGTCMFGGTLESFDYPIYVENGSHGGVFETDIEGCNNPAFLGNAFTGRIVPANGVNIRERADNITGVISTRQYSSPVGDSESHESYYQPSYLTFNADSLARPINFYRNSVSVIEGGALDANALKISFGMGFNGSGGVDSHPSQHFIGVGNRKVSFGAQSPSARAGNQIVAWNIGDVCFNSTGAYGYGAGWICVEAGTPGTWLPFGRLIMTVTVGNTNVNIASPGFPSTIIFATELTADRSVITNNNVSAGTVIRIARPAAGAFNLNVGTGPLKALAANTWCDITFDGAAWVLTGYGSL